MDEVDTTSERKSVLMDEVVTTSVIKTFRAGHDENLDLGFRSGETCQYKEKWSRENGSDHLNTVVTCSNERI